MAMLLAVQVFGQSRTVTGVIKDENGVPIAFATVKIKGARGGTQTRSDGSFSINVPTRRLNSKFPMSATPLKSSPYLTTTYWVFPW